MTETVSTLTEMMNQPKATPHTRMGDDSWERDVREQLRSHDEQRSHIREFDKLTRDLKATVHIAKNFIGDDEWLRLFKEQQAGTPQSPRRLVLAPAHQT